MREERERERERVVYSDNDNVCDTSISCYEAHKEPVITEICFCTIGNTAGFLSEVRMHLTSMGRQTIKMDKKFYN
jgi:hypothetical protein